MILCFIITVFIEHDDIKWVKVKWKYNNKVSEYKTRFDRFIFQADHQWPIAISHSILIQSEHFQIVWDPRQIKFVSPLHLAVFGLFISPQKLKWNLECRYQYPMKRYLFRLGLLQRTVELNFCFLLVMASLRFVCFLSLFLAFVRWNLSHLLLTYHFVLTA